MPDPVMGAFLVGVVVGAAATVALVAVIFDRAAF